MVCSRCKMVIKSELEKLAIDYTSIELGEIELKLKLDKSVLKQLANSLQNLGFEIIDDKKSKIISKIKSIIVFRIHHSNDISNINISTLITNKIPNDYNYLSNLFSEVEGITIENFYISQRIEKVKELLMYDELSLSQIADKLGYSSLAYLSNQFKKHTGLAPTFYKTLKVNKRKNIEEL